MSSLTTLRSIEQVLARISTDTIRNCRRAMDSGISAFPPQVGTHYEAFWLRDFAYMLEGNPDAFSDAECENACLLFIEAMREDGACVDCVAYDGTPIYMPGYGTMGRKPVADGSQFTVDVAWHTWKKTGNLELVHTILPALERAMRAIPINPQTGLVYIAPGSPRERCPYGFTDTVLKEGDLLFSSLLAVQAYRQLSDLSEAAGESGIEFRAKADTMAHAINTQLWDREERLYRAASLRCAQPDIWGSAFAVYTGVAPQETSKLIGQFFAEHHAGLTQHGQIRHLPESMYWEATRVSGGSVSPGTYQNGAYWATATGWYCYALAIADYGRAADTLASMVHDFGERGVHEWVQGDTGAVPGYVASAALPLEGIRRLLRAQE